VQRCFARGLTWLVVHVVIGSWRIVRVITDAVTDRVQRRQDVTGAAEADQPLADPRTRGYASQRGPVWWMLVMRIGGAMG
jgi:hypothetical protein